MKGVLVVIILVLIAALIGWISFSNGNSNAAITIDKQKIHDDTATAVDELEDATEETWEGARDALQSRDHTAPADVRESRPAPVEAAPP